MKRKHGLQPWPLRYRWSGALTIAWQSWGTPSSTEVRRTRNVQMWIVMMMFYFFLWYTGQKWTLLCFLFRHLASAVYFSSWTVMIGPAIQGFNPFLTGHIRLTCKTVRELQTYYCTMINHRCLMSRKCRIAAYFIFQLSYFQEHLSECNQPNRQ